MKQNDDPSSHPGTLNSVDQEFSPPIEIKSEFLTSDILNAVVQEFILREGTNYGTIEYSSEDKVSQVIRQIKKGDVKIVFDSQSESVTLMTAHDFKKATSNLKS